MPRPELPPKMLTEHQMQQNHEPHRRLNEAAKHHQQRLASMPKTVYSLMPYSAQWRYFEARLIEENQSKQADYQESYDENHL